MEEEYVTIVEAARRVGLSDKTVRRAIHDGKLEARYPHPNKAEVSITDLLTWHATLLVRPSGTQDRWGPMLESQVTELTARVTTLEGQLAEGQVTGPKKAPKILKTDSPAPEGFTYLEDFCRIHRVPLGTAGTLFPRAIRGQKIRVGNRNLAIIAEAGARGLQLALYRASVRVVCDIKESRGGSLTWPGLEVGSCLAQFGIVACIPFPATNNRSTIFNILLSAYTCTSCLLTSYESSPTT